MTIEIPAWFPPASITILLAGAGAVVKAVGWAVRREFALFEEKHKALRADLDEVRADVKDQGRRLAGVEARLGFAGARGGAR